MAPVRCKSCGKDNPPEARFCANCGATLATRAKPPARAGVAVEYMGFWIRLGAAIIDSIVVWLISSALSIFLIFDIVGYRDLFLSSILWLLIPWLYYWLFTGLKGQTLGKMAVRIKVVNAAGSVPGLGRAALREIPGKILSSIGIYLGFLWVAWDKRKQGWHDKIASTYVVRVKSRQ